jgi:hypothetical protein
MGSTLRIEGNDISLLSGGQTANHLHSHGMNTLFSSEYDELLLNLTRNCSF